jgi:hypothetical protein
MMESGEQSQAMPKKGTKARRHGGTKGFQPRPSERLVFPFVPTCPQERRRAFVHSRSAFTVLEMILAISISSVVLAAMATMTLSVSRGWTALDGTQSLQIQSALSYNRIRYHLSSAQYIGGVVPGSMTPTPTTAGSVFYWAYDGLNGVSDGKPEVGEMALIQHDTTTNTIWLYQPIAYSSMTTTQQTSANVVISYASMIDPTWPATFKALSYVTKTALARNVQGAIFNAMWLTSTAQRPAVEFTLLINRAPQPAATQYDIAVLRAPNTQPN